MLIFDKLFRGFNKKKKKQKIELLENINGTYFSKNALILYMTAPFLPDNPNKTHQNMLQVKELVKIVGNYKYNVDLVDFNNKLQLNRTYDLIIDIHPGIAPIYEHKMSPDCKKIAYITGSNPDFSIKAELLRVQAANSRTGATLKQRRIVNLFRKDVLDTFDSFFLIGNEHTRSTFNEYAANRFFLIRNTGYINFPQPDFSKKQTNNFLYFASFGQIHKGLDLLLEVFSKNKNINLYVCSNFESEGDFYRAYKRYLYKNKNIFPIGFVDINSKQYQQIADKCSYVVMPSCSEGMAGSILTGMSSGLIPIVSRECGLDEGDVYIFENCSIDCIDKTLTAFARKSSEWIRHESSRIQQIVRDKYSMNNYREQIRAALTNIIPV
ncbi:MAG: hypothetical protein DKM50_05990 [Candidatus Margulisiibacteriota bacterium]|nr:MAG: hypothetical protein A2X42_09145 [Candidatus Margulisbacteria bacterium GWF2_38_17]OGI07845.1 MAG: hypothetical protein A2X41_12010 [Candidatus Margulisbacteria bacterium GWE2_39_32]PZM80099.1 MAG: hypothetical protein DKM50_05990 [Candidatus Margulisiibacteriota bacterium]HCT84363.1 hypothetical protein [Candidatus Margulisiibacteriota bacterium]HCY35783.1 hypothetical protein [Candidatus Margulisiibacteriota bacterium]